MSQNPRGIQKKIFFPGTKFNLCLKTPGVFRRRYFFPEPNLTYILEPSGDLEEDIFPGTKFNLCLKTPGSI